ncbi:CRISPR-associated protein Cas6 [Haloferax sp. Atlit-6N]|uniref:CRISPR-associated endoribonuclease Cas6 n=1 Tax=Haloferax sp. Atlit-6N TaxID=2077205 RepID=UPI000E23D63E|nr:CRISPR-associated endoribonuclease Cas6 [Haloferax sp. Atlit-6N]REA02045.1 CRISPR-associated protein Cas6 [Haloferax sp. Atlit-6N]
MRLEVSLRSTVNMPYDRSYHHALRSALWDCLRPEYSAIHESNEPVGLSFSNIFPWGELTAGDRRKLRIASPDRAVLDTLAEALMTTDRLTVGDMEFDVDDISVHAPDVGEPGSRGYLETATGVVCRLSPSLLSDHDLTATRTAADDASPTFWRPAHGLEPFRAVLAQSLTQSHQRFGATETYDIPITGDIFDSFEPIKDGVTYALPFEPTAGVELTYILSKWRLGYRVRDDTHRYLLNLALDCGIGQRREHGFGFVNTYSE